MFPANVIDNISSFSSAVPEISPFRSDKSTGIILGFCSANYIVEISQSHFTVLYRRHNCPQTSLFSGS